MLRAFVKMLILPPGGLLLAGLAGLLLARVRRRPGLALTATALVALWILSTSAVGNWLLGTLEGPPIRLSAPAQAIVILAGDLTTGAIEYGGVTVGALTLERLRFGARLQRATGLPVLVTGGTLDEAPVSLASLMAQTLAEDYGIATTWTEGHSRTTEDNATMSAPLLRAAGVHRVFLVTHAWHMPRARAAFERVGLEVEPAPMGFVGGALDVLSFLPSVQGLQHSYWALHELAGRVWYRLAYGTS